MNFISAIRNLLKTGNSSNNSEGNLQKEDTPHNRPQDENVANSRESEPGLGFLDGMSTGTARFIIDREVTQELLEKYDIKDLENKGRYYLAKIVNQDGEVADIVLIDKLNRSIHFQKAKFK